MPIGLSCQQNVCSASNNHKTCSKELCATGAPAGKPEPSCPCQQIHVRILRLVEMLAEMEWEGSNTGRVGSRGREAAEGDGPGSNGKCPILSPQAASSHPFLSLGLCQLEQFQGDPLQGRVFTEEKGDLGCNPNLGHPTQVRRRQQQFSTRQAPR